MCLFGPTYHSVCLKLWFDLFPTPNRCYKVALLHRGYWSGFTLVDAIFILLFKMNSHLLFALCLVTICVAEAAVGPQEPSVGTLPEASEIPAQEGAQLSQQDAPVPIPSARRISGPILLLVMSLLLLSGLFATVDYKGFLSSLKQKAAAGPQEPEGTEEPEAPSSGDPKAPEVSK